MDALILSLLVFSPFLLFAAAAWYEEKFVKK